MSRVRKRKRSLLSKLTSSQVHKLNQVLLHQFQRNKLSGIIPAMLLGLVSSTLRESARNAVGKLTPTVTAGLRFYSFPHSQGPSGNQQTPATQWGFLLEATKSNNSKDAGISLDPETVWRQREKLVKYLPRPPGPYSGA